MGDSDSKPESLFFGSTKHITSMIAAMKIEKAESEYPEFQAPSGFTIPEGKVDGDTFDAVATFKVKGAGVLCLTAVEGNPIEGEAEEDPMEDEMEGESDDESMVAPQSTEEEEKPSKGSAGDRFMAAFRTKRKPVPFS